jgi:long-chain acyl-CoA synthetase
VGIENLGTLLADAARRFAAREATGGMRFAELLDAAQAIHGELAKVALAPHEPVHVRVSNQPPDLAAYLGVWLAGGVVVPVHRTAPNGAVAQVSAKTRARFEWDGSLTRLAEEPPPRRPMLEGAALVVFTSGSSGLPKGAVLSHRAFAGKLAAIQSMLGFAEGERTLLVLNITFSFGIWVALLTLLHGGVLLPRERFSAASFLAELAEDRVTRVAVVPTMMRSLILDRTVARLEAEARNVAAAGALRQVLIGGETLGKGLGETLRGLLAPAQLIDIYGLTETSTCDFFLMPADAGRYAGCIGRPAPGVRYRIAGDDGAPVAPGEIGELMIASAFLMSGYLDEPALDPVRDGWLATGDLARERDASVVEIAGRKKELIYRGGNKVAPQEIEFVCSAHPRVAAALAIGRPDERLGERIHALIVPRDGGLSAAELRSFLRERLEKYKQPDVLYFAAELPAGRTGKADRARFRAMLEQGELAPVVEAA